jgi:hypothetical protein
MSYYCDTCGKFYKSRKPFINHPCFKELMASQRVATKPSYTGEFAGELNDLYEQTRKPKVKKVRKFIKYDKVREISGRAPGEKKSNRLPKLAATQAPGANQNKMGSSKTKIL